jgi:NTE family protein
VTEALRHRPDVLVLGSGGRLGEAWMRGVLSGLGAAGGIDFRGCEYFLGTSAGAIVAAALAGGREPEAGDRAAAAWAAAAREPADGEDGEDVSADADAADGGRLAAASRAVLLGAARTGIAAATPLAPLALAATAPGGAAARALTLARAPRPTRTLDGLAARIAGLGAHFDGRLRIAAVDRRSGRRVLFGAPGAPRASVPEAVLASCAVPWLFAPVEIGGREYVDGGVWSPTNLDAVPAASGMRVLCLDPTGAPGLAPPPGPTAGARSSVSRAAVLTETLAVRARGAQVTTLAPDPEAAEAIGADPMDASRAEEVLDAAVAQGVRLATASQ